MKPSDYKISLDILESQSQYSLPMKKGDTARVVYITLREGGVPYEIGRDCFAVLSGRKPDGTVLENNCVIKGNTIIYEITSQTTAVSGLVDCEIKLYSIDNGLICSPRFSIIVDERVVSDEEVESTSEFTALTNLYAESRNAENERVKAEQIRVENENKRVSNFSNILKQGENALKEINEATDSANDIADTLQEKLDSGELKGEKGDKGDKGDTPNLDNVANAVKVSASGNPMFIDDASPIPHTLDIKTTANETVYVRGKNLIPFDNKSYNNGKYVAGQTYEVNGINLTINDDGSVYAKGTSTDAVVFPLFDCPSFATGIHTVTLSGSPEGASATTYCLRLKNGTEATANYEDYGNGKTVNNVDLSSSKIYIIIIGGQTVDATFYPMLEFGEVASEFVPPCESVSATADENGVVNGLVSVAKEMSIFTETDASVECVYNQDTEKALKSYVDTVIGGIENGSY